MLGAIIGDIVGSRWEFDPTNDYNFELFSDENSYTDDTICTVAVADALLKGRDYGESIHEWCRRYPHPMGGYGARFVRWVQSDNPQPYGSFGNGSAMRVSPIGMWFDDREQIYPEAEKCAACTHNHPEGIKGAQAVAWAVYWAVKSFDGVLTAEQMNDEICDIVTTCLSDMDYDIEVDYENFRNIFDETCQGTVPVALDIIFKSDSFVDAIRKAVSLGADADTLGAIVGSIAEHIWGIPLPLIKKAMSYLPEEMRQVVRDFYRSCHNRPTYKPRLGEKAEAQKKEHHALMRWKLGLGNLNNVLRGESPLPPKQKVATAADWQQPMPSDPDNTTRTPFDFRISAAAMDVIRKGHLPESQEDHWYMYCDEEYVRYYRSWTGVCGFEAHYQKDGDGYLFDHLTINHALVEFGVNGDEAGAALFRYLIIAESESDAEQAWQNYIDAWERINAEYTPHTDFWDTI